MRKLNSEIDLYKTKINAQKEKERKFRKIAKLSKQQQEKINELEKEVVKYKAKLAQKLSDFEQLKKEHGQTFKDLILERARRELLENKAFVSEVKTSD